MGLQARLRWVTSPTWWCLGAAKGTQPHHRSETLLATPKAALGRQDHTRAIIEP
jgi:hypothetical protein